MCVCGCVFTVKQFGHQRVAFDYQKLDKPINTRCRINVHQGQVVLVINTLDAPRPHSTGTLSCTEACPEASQQRADCNPPPGCSPPGCKPPQAEAGADPAGAHQAVTRPPDGSHPMWKPPRDCHSPPDWSPAGWSLPNRNPMLNAQLNKASVPPAETAFSVCGEVFSPSKSQ